MQNPYSDSYGHTLDKSTWDKLIKDKSPNPFTTEEINPSALSPNTELKRKIDLSQDKLSEELNPTKKRKL